MPEDELGCAISGEDMLALADRALFWPREGTLFVADVHFGKDATFRHALRWIPPGTTGDDLARLSRLVERYAVKRLVILGDAFHSEHAGEEATLQQLREWRRHLNAAVLMVKGNHDRRAGEIARELDFEIADEGHALAPFSLRHHPTAKPSDGYTLCGHVHPVATARGRARQSLRVPCFWIQPWQCTLPAFGGFTGGGSIRPATGDRVILAADGQVVDPLVTGTRQQVFHPKSRKTEKGPFSE